MRVHSMNNEPTEFELSHGRVLCLTGARWHACYHHRFEGYP